MRTNFCFFQNFNYKKDAIFVGYAFFLLSLALEYSVNEFRTFALICLLVSVSFSPDLLQFLKKSKIIKACLFFPVVAFFSWLIGPYGSDGLKTFDWIFVLTIGYVAAYSRPREAILLLLILPVAIFIASIVTYCSYALGYLRLEDIYYSPERLKLYNRSTNRMGFVLAAGVAICCGLGAISGRHRGFAAVLLPFLFVLCWMTQSRSAFFAVVGVLIVFICYEILLYRKKMHWVFALFSIVCVASVIIYSGNGRISQTFTSGSLEYLYNGREDIWRAAWEIFLKSPIFGFGVDSFHDALNDHLAIPGNAERLSGLPVPNIFWNAHQIILGVLAEMGLAGLLIFIFITVRGLRNGFAGGPEALPPLLVFLAYLIAGIGGYGFHRSWNSAFFFLSLGLIEGVNAAKKISSSCRS